MNDSVITFSGWVGSRVDLVELREGMQVATFRVGSTPRRLRDGRWEDGETVWYSVKAWRHLAANLAESLRQGDPVLVTGRLTTETWTKEDGSVGSRQVVVANALGHDLNRGTSAFLRSVPAARRVLPQDAARDTSQPASQDADHEVAPDAGGAQPEREHAVTAA